MPQPNVSMRKSDYARALNVAEQFNIQGHAHPNRKVKAVLKDAVAFMKSVIGEVKKGNAIETGSAWHGPDEFLSKDSAVKLGRKRERADYLTGTVDVAITKREAEGLSEIRKAFKLSSDKQAAGLAIRVYQSVADGLWRGNGFSYAQPNAPALDTDKIKNRVIGSRNP